MIDYYCVSMTHGLILGGGVHPARTSQNFVQALVTVLTLCENFRPLRPS